VPDLAIIAESSLMSILRWSYKAGMDKSMSSSNGQITLVLFMTCPSNLIMRIWSVDFRFSVVKFRSDFSLVPNICSSFRLNSVLLLSHPYRAYLIQTEQFFFYRKKKEQVSFLNKT